MILLKSSSQDPTLASSKDKVQFQNLLSSPDGYLQFLLGQCYEKAGDDSTTSQKAKEMYEAAIKHDKKLSDSERIEARERLAMLLRDRVKDLAGADHVINEMVEKYPNDYRANLSRGRYHLAQGLNNPSQQSNLLEVKADFERAKSLAPSEPAVYLALADAELNGSTPNYSKAKQHLKDGLKKAPASTALW